MPNPPFEFFLNKKAPCIENYSDCPVHGGCVGEGSGCPIDGRHENVCRRCEYPRPCESIWDNQNQKYVNPLSKRAEELFQGPQHKAGVLEKIRGNNYSNCSSDKSKCENCTICR